MKRKIIWIQHFTIGLIISAAILLPTSCTKDEEQSERLIMSGYVYFNTTQHHISITSYNSQMDSTYVMFPGDTLLLFENLTTGKSFNSFLISDADSVKVIFDFSRISFFTRDSSSFRNIINLSNYDYENAYEGDEYYNAYLHKFTFEFTEEDYENAVEQLY